MLKIKLMRKLALFISFTLVYFLFVSLAYAQAPTNTPTPTLTPTPFPTTTANPCLNTGAFEAICKLGKEGAIGSVLGAFASLFFVVAAITAVLYLIYGGIKWITSRGDKTEVEAARNHIIAAITGLIVVFLAFFLINFVLQFIIPGFSITNIQIPSLTK